MKQPFEKSGIYNLLPETAVIAAGIAAAIGAGLVAGAAGSGGESDINRSRDNEPN